MLNTKTIKSLLFLSLITTLTLFTSCSKDDDIAEQPMKLGDIEIKVDDIEFSVKSTRVGIIDGYVNQNTGTTIEDRLELTLNNNENIISLDIKELMGSKTYELNQDNFVTYSRVLAKNVKRVSPTYYYSTKNNSDNNIGNITVSEYNKDEKTIKVTFEATLKNSEGDIKTIKGKFYKEFSLID